MGDAEIHLGLNAYGYALCLWWGLDRVPLGVGVGPRNLSREVESCELLNICKCPTAALAPEPSCSNSSSGIKTRSPLSTSSQCLGMEVREFDGHQDNLSAIYLQVLTLKETKSIWFYLFNNHKNSWTTKINTGQLHSGPWWIGETPAATFCVQFCVEWQRKYVCAIKYILCTFRCRFSDFH